MNIVVNEEDYLQIQNIKVKEYDKNRVSSKSKDVRLEARIEKLELKMDDVTTEFKLMTKTLINIDDTLKQLKDEMKQLHQFDISIVRIQDRLDNQQTLIKKLFEKSDDAEKRLNEISKVEAGNNIKINNSERIFWFIVTGAIGALGWFNK